MENFRTSYRERREQNENSYVRFIRNMGGPILSEETLKAAFTLVGVGVKRTHVIGLHGPGNFSRVANNSARVDVFDPNCQMIDFGKRFAIENNLSGIVSFYQGEYERIAPLLNGNADIVFIDHTFNHAQNPVELIKAIKIGNPDKLVVIRGFGNRPITIHRQSRHRRSDELSDPLWFSGFNPSVFDLLKDGVTPLHFTHLGTRTYGFPKRIRNGIPIQLRGDMQDVLSDGKIFAKGVGLIEVDFGIQQLKSGNSEYPVWLEGENFYPAPKSPSSKKYVLGKYNTAEIIVTASDLDPEKLALKIPRNHW